MCECRRSSGRIIDYQSHLIAQNTVQATCPTIYIQVDRNKTSNTAQACRKNPNRSGKNERRVPEEVQRDADGKGKKQKDMMVHSFAVERDTLILDYALQYLSTDSLPVDGGAHQRCHKH